MSPTNIVQVIIKIEQTGIFDLVDAPSSGEFKTAAAWLRDKIRQFIPSQDTLHEQHYYKKQVMGQVRDIYPKLGKTYIVFPCDDLFTLDLYDDPIKLYFYIPLKRFSFVLKRNILIGYKN